MTWGTALRLGRISNLPTVWTNALVGTALAGGALDAQLGLAVLALSLFYIAGMYLNDAFDQGFDAEQRPDRPIPSGQVSARVVFASGFVMLVVGLGLLCFIGFALRPATGWRGAVAGAGLAAAIIGYDAWHKGNPLSPVLMGLCRALVYITAGLLIASPLPARVLVAAAVAFCYLIGLTYAAKQEKRRSFGAVWPLAFLAAPVIYGLPTVAMGGTGVLVYALFIACLGYALSLLVLPHRINVPRAVICLIAGISLLDAVFIAGYGQPAWAWLAVLAFAATLLLQRLVAGT